MLLPPGTPVPPMPMLPVHLPGAPLPLAPRTALVEAPAPLMFPLAADGGAYLPPSPDGGR